jgi:hypothetical protein
MSNVGQLQLEARLTTAAGEPIAGADVTFELEGDGSLAPTHDAKGMRRETNADGIAKATWYRRGIFGRDVKAALSASVPEEDRQVALRALSPDEVVSGPRTSWVPQVHKFR